MNHSCRLAGSAVIGASQVASGFAHMKGSAGSGANRSIRLRPLAAAVAIVAGLIGPAAHAQTDMTITGTGTTTAPCAAGTCTSNSTVSVLTAGDLQAALSGGSVTVDAAAGTGNGTGSIDWTDGAVDAYGNSLTLTAASSITFDGGLTSLDNLSFGGTSLHGSGFAAGTGAITGLGHTAFDLTGTRAGSAGGIMFSGFASADAAQVTGASGFDYATASSGGMTFANATSVIGTGSIAGLGSTAFDLLGTGAGSAGGIMFSGFTSADATTVTGAAVFDAGTRVGGGIAFDDVTSVVGTGSGATLTGTGLTYALDDNVADAGSVNQVGFTGFGNIDDATGTIVLGGASRTNGNVTVEKLDYTSHGSATNVNLSGAGTTGVGGTVSGVSEVDAAGPLAVSGSTNDGPLALVTTGPDGTLALGPLSVGSLAAGSSSDLLVSGSVVSDAGATLTSAGAVSEGASGGIMAGTLAGRSVGAATLTGLNQVADLGNFVAAGFDLVNGQTLVVSGAVDGGAAGTAVTTTAGDLMVTGAVGSVAGTTALVSAGMISEATSGVVLADTLTGSSTGATSLSGANGVANLGDFTADGFDLNDDGTLNITGALVSPTVTLSDATDPIVLTGTIDTIGGAGGASGPGADGAGAVTIDGSLHMLGDIDLGVDGTARGEFGSVDVTGGATFGAPGAFHFAFGDDFIAAAGDTFDFFTAASIDGFAYVENSLDCDGLAPGLVCGLRLNDAGNGLLLTLHGTALDVPEPNPVGLLGMGLALIGGAVGWRKARRGSKA